MKALWYIGTDFNNWSLLGRDLRFLFLFLFWFGCFLITALGLAPLYTIHNITERQSKHEMKLHSFFYSILLLHIFLYCLTHVHHSTTPLSPFFFHFFQSHKQSFNAQTSNQNNLIIYIFLSSEKQHF